MKKLIYLLSAGLLFCFMATACGGSKKSEESKAATTTSAVESNGKIVLAYVTGHGNKLPDPAYMTHINYAFGHVNETFNGVNISNEGRLREIVGLKKQKPSLKVLLSIGGWTSGRFSEMAATEETRNAFAKDCGDIVKNFGLDGIDMDWEYPTSSEAGISSSPDDIENYNLLMKAIREAIGNDKLLTLASAANHIFYDFKTLMNYIDFVNLMTYDMARVPNHQSALYRSEMAPKRYGDAAVKLHVEAGVPMDKLVLGMPFYGRGRLELTDYVDYRDLIHLKGFTEKWDDDAKVPYLENAKGEVVLVFDNPRSLTIKCDYIKEKGMLGAMYWEYNCDDAEGTLRNTVWNNMNN